MKINPFKNPRLKAGNGMNAFPLAHTESFTSPFGALLPVSFYHVTAKSKFRVDMENQTIMTPVIRPPFSRMFEHFEFFAVPMCQLQQSFDNLITGVSNYENSAVLHFNRNTGTAPSSVGLTPSAVPTFDGRAIEWLLYHQQNQVDFFGCSKNANTCRLFDLLGYGNYYQFVTDGIDLPTDSATTPQSTIKRVLPQNFYNLLAYQKIYYSHYCNSKYESINTQAFNIDDFQPALLYQGSSTASDEMMKRFMSICEMHYRWKPRDYFTSVNPSVLPTQADFGFKGLDEFPLPSEFSIFGVPGTSLNTDDSRPIVVDDTDETSLTNATGQSVQIADSMSSLSVAAVRFAFAYDKLLRRMRTAGSDFNSQMLAQFGIAPSDKRHGAAKYLGGYTNQLRFDEVTASADAGGAALGDIAGKMSAYNQNRRTIEYEAQEDTIIMCIYSTSVDMQYHSFNLSRENLRRFRFDWFNEAFQDLGLQAIFKAEYSYIEEVIFRDRQANFICEPVEQKQILGYVKRYLEYKTKVNRVHGLLQWPYNNPDGKSWVVQNSDLQQVSSTDPDERWQTLKTRPFAIYNLVFNPFTLNDIVQVPYSGAWNTDHFNVFAYFNVKVIAPISADGEQF